MTHTHKKRPVKLSPLSPIHLAPFNEAAHHLGKIERPVFELLCPQEHRFVSNAVSTRYSKRLKAADCSAFHWKENSLRSVLSPKRPKVTANTLVLSQSEDSFISPVHGTWRLDVSGPKSSGLGLESIDSFCARSAFHFQCDPVKSPAPPLPALTVSPRAVNMLESREYCHDKPAPHSVSVILPHLPKATLATLNTDIKDTDPPMPSSPTSLKRGDTINISQESPVTKSSRKVRIDIPKA